MPDIPSIHTDRGNVPVAEAPSYWAREVTDDRLVMPEPEDEDTLIGFLDEDSTTDPTVLVPR